MPYNTGVEVLKDLFRLSGRGIAQTTKGYMDWTTQSSPIALLGQLIGQSSGVAGQQNLQQSVKGTQTEQAIKQGKAKDPFIQGAEKALKESGYAMAQESIAKQGPQATVQKLMEMEQPEEQPNQPEQEQSEMNLATNPQQQPEQAKPLSGMDILKGILPMLNAPEIWRNKMESQRLGLEQQRQTVGGQEPLQRGRKEELGIMHQNRINEIMISAQLKGEEITPERASALTAAQSLVSLVNLRESILMKGPGLGQLAGIGGAMGLGRQERAEFESSVSQFVFDVGALLGQKGRSFTGTEQKMVKSEIIKASLSSTAGDWHGRMNAVIKRINTLYGEEILPPMKQLTEQLKTQRKQSGSTTQKLSAELDAINKRLAELGGE